MEYNARVKVWKQFLHETGIECRAYLSDVPISQLTEERQAAITEMAYHCADWEVIPYKTHSGRWYYWTLWDTNRGRKNVV